jgi:hypothetical protein
MANYRLVWTSSQKEAEAQVEALMATHAKVVERMGFTVVSIEEDKTATLSSLFLHADKHYTARRSPLPPAEEAL